MNSDHVGEVERLARTLRTSRLATSESEAYRMAQEMLSTSKKVSDDHKEREKALLGAPKRNIEAENAQKIIEKITSNAAQGKPNIRIDLGELDLEKPLKELIPDEAFHQEADEDDAVVVGESRQENFGQDLGGAPVEAAVESHGDEDDYYDDKDDDGTEEEKAQPAGGNDAESILASVSDSPESGEEFDSEVTVKEL